ncbi:MAG: hypothetical protein EA352_02330 [Gemmatimonadales bacterium]|nr:MAG: hypothetical protein EA352_02330 [Gemmatimonadales bacterium]
MHRIMGAGRTAPLDREALFFGNAAALEAFRQEDCTVIRPDTLPHAIHKAGLSFWETNPVNAPDLMCFATESGVYELRPSGDAVRIAPEGERGSFQVPFASDFELRSVLYRETDDRLYLVYGVGDGLYGSGHLMAWDKTTLEPLWDAHTHVGPSPGPVLLTDEHAVDDATGILLGPDVFKGKEPDFPAPEPFCG